VCGVLRLIGCVPQNIALLKYRQTLSLKAPNCKRIHSGTCLPIATNHSLWWWCTWKQFFETKERYQNTSTVFLNRMHWNHV